MQEYRYLFSPEMSIIIKYLENFIRFCVICSTSITIFNLQNSYIWTTATSMNPVCNSSDCHKLGNMYLKHMNKHGDPCTDFYDYACGGWEAEHPRLDYLGVWNNIALMQKNAANVVRRLLEDKTVSKIKAVEKAKEWYRACLNFPTLEQKYNASVVKIIMLKIHNCPIILAKTAKPLPDCSWWAVDNEYIKKSGESALFKIFLKTEPTKNYHILAKLGRLFSPYGVLRRFKAWSPFSRKKNHYQKFLIKLVQHITPKFLLPHNIDNIEKDVDNVVTFRENLREIINGTRLKLETISIRMLRLRYPSDIGQNVHINWIEAIRSIFKGQKDPSGDLISDITRVVVDVNYFDQLWKLLQKTPERVIANHIHLYFAERHMILTPDVEEELSQSIDDQKTESGYVRHFIPRWRYCTQNHDMYTTVEEMYANAVFPERSIRDVQQLLAKTKKMLAEEIVKSTWLKYNVKLSSIQKIKSLQHTIGYTDFYNSSATPVSGKNHLDPMSIDAYYAIGENHLYISAANLQLPLYSPDLPMIIKLGCTMGLLGHELYHAFDEIGQLCGRDGKRPGWPRDMCLIYEKQTNCFDDIYNKFKKREISDSKVGLLKQLAVRKTTVEDVADAMSLKLSFKAYLEFLQKEKSICTVLPGFEKIGCDKLFFIAFANEFCAAYSAETAKHMLLSDDHSPPRVRVNAAVANIKEFSSAFGCKAKDPMYLKNSCDIWNRYP